MQISRNRSLIASVKNIVVVVIKRQIIVYKIYIIRQNRHGEHTELLQVVQNGHQ